MTNRSFYPTLKLQGLNCRNYGTPFPVHFPPLSSYMCNNAPMKPSLQVSFLHIPPNFKSNLAYMLLYLVQSASTPLFSAKLTKGYICKSVNILNSFIPYHQISSYLPTFTKFTKYLLYHWKLKKKCGNIE